MNKFEEAFEKLKKDGKTSVDGLINWMKETKLIESTKEAEEKVRHLFSNVKDKQNVELQNFKEAIVKLAEDQKKNLEDMTKNLAEQGPRLIGAVMAGASAFKEAFTKK